jgi:glycosyltransferase involved in cell wall biosynthesis
VTTVTANHRLCLASPVFFPTYGGSQLRFKRYLPGLSARGLDIRVYTGTPNSKEMSAAEAAQWGSYPVGKFMPASDIDGIPVHRVRLPDAKGKRRTRTYNKNLLQLCDNPDYRPDVLQMVGPLKPLSIPLLKKLRKRGIPTLYAVTVAPPKTAKRQWFSLKQRKEIELFNLLDCIVTNNRPLKDYVRDMGIETRVEIIPNGVDLSRFRPANDSDECIPLRSRLGIGSNDIMITSVGGIMPRKGSDLLIEAWSRLAADHPNVHLVLVGPRKDIEQPGLKLFRRKLESLVEQSGAPDRVHFTGLSNEVDVLVRASDIFVLPSEREGMPNSVLEAMASRVPVVITPFKGLSPDLGTAGSDYLLCDRSADGLTATLQQLLDNSELRQRIAHAGYNWVTQTLSLDKSLDRYAALYHELAEQGRMKVVDPAVPPSDI